MFAFASSCFFSGVLAELLLVLTWVKIVAEWSAMQLFEQVILCKIKHCSLSRCRDWEEKVSASV